MDTIKIRCKGSGLSSLEELKAFQGNLKELNKENHDKLKNEILKVGFIEPISVWKNNILNGHQRLKVLYGLKEEGYEIPKIPINEISAKNVMEAKRMVLALTSQYGRINPQGLYEYLEEFEIDVRELSESYRLPDLNIGVFKESYYKEEDDGDLHGISEEDSEMNYENYTKCPKCGFYMKKEK